MWLLVFPRREALGREDVLASASCATCRFLDSGLVLTDRGGIYILEYSILGIPRNGDKVGPQ